MKRLASVLTAGALLVLSGCGSAQPGVAARVGDQELSLREVDTATTHLCTALGDQLRGNGQVIAMGAVRQAVLQYLTVRTIASEIADEYGVEPGADYERDLAQQQATAQNFPEEVRADYTRVMSSQAYATSVLDAAGRAALAAEGNDDPTVDEVSAKGTELFEQWPQAHELDVDPRFGIDVSTSNLAPVDTNLSVAVSQTAQDGLELDPDPAYAATLPANQRCGG